jgi:amino acid permease
LGLYIFSRNGNDNRPFKYRGSDEDNKQFKEEMFIRILLLIVIIPCIYIISDFTSLLPKEIRGFFEGVFILSLFGIPLVVIVWSVVNKIKKKIYPEESYFDKIEKERINKLWHEKK